MTTTETPAYMAGHLAPVPDEISAVDLPVHGALPPELTGRYLRNGPNPLPGEDPGHWFAGHGMVHGVRLREGRAEWYRNRWVRTGALAGRQFMGPDGVDRTAVTANTHIIEHGGALLALVESGLPYELTPDLDTVGPQDFGGRLTTAMTAHPKEDPRTGALHFFAYSPIAPHLVYHRLSATNELELSAEVPGAGPSMMHDFAVTDRHALFLDLPMVFKMDQVGRAGLPFGWDADYPARIGVMPLDRPGEVTWIGIDPCYVFHVGGAHTDEAGRIVLDACRYDSKGIDRLWGTIGGGAAGPAADAASTGRATLHRWTIDPVAATITETALDDRPAEFPTFDDRRMGTAARYLYTVSERGSSAALVKHDHATGTATSHELGADVVTGEAVFVPADGGTAEDDGWLVSITTSRDGSASQLVVLDATDVAAAPVAAVDLPRGVPAGFHGSWVPDA